MYAFEKFVTEDQPNMAAEPMQKASNENPDRDGSATRELLLRQRRIFCHRVTAILPTDFHAFHADALCCARDSLLS